MGSKTFKEKLRMANKNFAGAKERADSKGGSFGSDIEDGRYRAQLVSAELGESQSSGRLQVAWEYDILEGESKGESLRSYDGVETEDNLMWLIRKLNKFGYEDVEDLEGVASILEELTQKKPHVRVRVKTKGEFQNVYIDKVVAKDDSGSGAAEPDDVPEDPDPEDPEGEELEVGMNVSFESKGETLIGEVVEILEDEEKARVDVDGTVWKVKAENLTIEEGKEDAEPESNEDAEPEPEPEPEPKKKPSKKKVKKTKKKGKRR